MLFSCIITCTFHSSTTNCKVFKKIQLKHFLYFSTKKSFFQAVQSCCLTLQALNCYCILVVNILQNQHVVVIQSLTCNGEVCCYRHMLLGEII